MSLSLVLLSQSCEPSSDHQTWGWHWQSHHRTITNSTAVNILMHTSWKTYVEDIYSGVKLLVHRVLIYSASLNADSFPKCCTNLQSSQQFLRVLVTPLVFSSTLDIIFHFSHFGEYRVASHFCFNLQFPWWLTKVEIFFIYSFIDYLDILYCEISIQALCKLSTRLSDFFLLICRDSLCSPDTRYSPTHSFNVNL